MKKYCLQCDDGTELVLATKNVTVAAKGVTRVVPDVYGWHCPECGEVEFVDQENSRRHMDALDAVWKEAREREALEVRAIRKKLGLKQSDAARIFGGGINAFSEYERGKTQPHKSTVLLLRLLDRHPDLLDELTQ
jgi:HTH-type transcriptional regulator/antitoxin MqsA